MPSEQLQTFAWGFGWLGGARGKGKLRGLGGDGRFLLRGWFRVGWVWFALQCQAFDVFFLLSKCQNLAPLDDVIDARLGEEFPPGIRHFDLRVFLAFSTVIIVP